MKQQNCTSTNCGRSRGCERTNDNKHWLTLTRSLAHPIPGHNRRSQCSHATRVRRILVPDWHETGDSRPNQRQPNPTAFTTSVVLVGREVAVGTKRSHSHLHVSLLCVGRRALRFKRLTDGRNEVVFRKYVQYDRRQNCPFKGRWLPATQYRCKGAADKLGLPGNYSAGRLQTWPVISLPMQNRPSVGELGIISLARVPTLASFYAVLPGRLSVSGPREPVGLRHSNPTACLRNPAHPVLNKILPVGQDT
jgi:hypothetical protein